MDTISVIIPVYNVEKYLVRCVESIFNQSYTNIEILLIDDGSTDNSGKICDAFSQKDKRVRVFHLENSGAAASRKFGIENATGEYIAFVDSDDWIESTMYEKLYTCLIENDCDIVQCAYCKSNGEVNEPFTNEISEEVKVFSGRDGIYQLYGEREKGYFNFLLWNKLYKRKVFRDVEHPISLRSNNDVPIIPMVFFNSEKIGAVEIPLYYYFQRHSDGDGSITENLWKDGGKAVASHIVSFGTVSDYFKKRDSQLKTLADKYTLSWSLTALVHKEYSAEVKKAGLNSIKNRAKGFNKYLSTSKNLYMILVKTFKRVK